MVAKIGLHIRITWGDLKTPDGQVTHYISEMGMSGHGSKASAYLKDSRQVQSTAKFGNDYTEEAAVVCLKEHELGNQTALLLATCVNFLA